MFGRSLQVSLAKPAKTDKSDATPKKSPIDYAQIIRESGKETVKGVVVIVGAYVLADTLRQIAVNAAPKQ